MTKKKGHLSHPFPIHWAKKGEFLHPTIPLKPGLFHLIGKRMICHAALQCLGGRKNGESMGESLAIT